MTPETTLENTTQPVTHTIPLTEMAPQHKITPMMAQWHECKRAAKDALVFFRLGDFYEAFEEDAKIISSLLNLTLTERAGTPMCGVPWHTCENYIDRLVAKGYRVAISEQMEDPKKVKGLVKREIVRTVTPGTQITSSLLNAKCQNFFAAITKVGKLYGLSFIDITTGDSFTFESSDDKEVFNELTKLQPKELLAARSFLEKEKSLVTNINLALNIKIHKEEEWRFEQTSAEYALKSHFKVLTLDGMGLKDLNAAISASGALFRHIRDELHISLDHIRTIKPYATNDHLLVDRATAINLELIEPLHEGKEAYTLLSTLDSTKTSMGGRLLRHYMATPLTNVQAINLRLDGVEALKNLLTFDPKKALGLENALNSIFDIERLIVKVTTGFAGPKDLIALAKSLAILPKVKMALENISSDILQEAQAKIFDLQEITNLILNAIIDNPPIKAADGGFFKPGFSEALDELTHIKTQSQEWLLNYQTRLREETGIKTLKVGFTRMFGYYIEVSRGQADRMPESFARRQTLVNAERYISGELKEFEEKIFSADEKIAVLENALFKDLINKVGTFYTPIMESAHAVATIDLLFSFARIAKERRYTRPTVNTSKTLEIEGLRHPVIELFMTDKKFVPNNIQFDGEQTTLKIITGPNMAGKSTYIRQVAIAVFMAHLGCFVPAEKAVVGIVDKLFCRIGASDDLTRGQSTFMVEMCETAHILNNATDRSLVILDEIGRGTSTYDGISIAWAVVEYLSTEKEKRAKTLFATHYYELTELENQFPNVKNFTVAISETKEGIHFLYTIIPGKTDKSWGVHVAKLAGLPKKVITRAEELLHHFKTEGEVSTPISNKEPLKQCVDLFGNSILQEIQAVDLMNITPLQAMQFIASWKKNI